MDSYNVTQLLGKLKSSDQDLRFMALNDLQTEINRLTPSNATAFASSGSSAGSYYGARSGSLDYHTEKKVVDAVVGMLSDGITEVKNNAVTTIGCLIPKLTEQSLLSIVDSLIALTNSKEGSDRDIANLGLRTVIRELPSTGKLASSACHKLIPKLCAQLSSGLPPAPTNGKPATASSSSGATQAQDTLLGCTELLSEILISFEAIVRATPALQTQILQVLAPLLDHARPAVRKRTVDALGFLIASSSDSVAATLVEKTVMPALDSGDVEVTKTGMGLVISLANKAPREVTQARMNYYAARVQKAAISADDDELKEQALNTLQTLLVKCPAEFTEHLSTSIEIATKLCSYDPNYAGDDDGDADMAADDEDDAMDDEYEDEYSDDDDVTWKVRKAAIKLLAASVDTYSEQLPLLAKLISPTLAQRATEREETVRLDVWKAYTHLLDLVRTSSDRIASASSPPSSESQARLKRKRTQEAMNLDGGPYSLIESQSSQMMKALLSHLESKSLLVRQHAFELLKALVLVLEGSLESYAPQLATAVCRALATSAGGVNAMASALKIETLQFLTAFVTYHPVRVYERSLEELIARLVDVHSDSFSPVAAQAFATSSAFIKTGRPLTPVGQKAAPLDSTVRAAIAKIYASVLARLSGSLDQEVRDPAIVCLGNVFLHAGDSLGADSKKGLALLAELIQREVTRSVTLKTITSIAQARTNVGTDFDEWTESSLLPISTFLRQSNRTLKVDAMTCLPTLILRGGPDLSDNIILSLLRAVLPFASTEDLPLMPLALTTLRAILEVKPELMTNKSNLSELLAPLQVLGISPDVHGVALDRLCDLFGTLVREGVQPLPLVTRQAELAGTTAANSDAKTSSASIRMAFSVTARVIGAIIAQDPTKADDASAPFLTQLSGSKSAGPVQSFSLLVLGEIGRLESFPKREKAVELATKLNDATSEEVRASAAFAIGNLAVGDAQKYLPVIVQSISDAKKRTQALLALKAFISHSPVASLSSEADKLWTPLLEVCAIPGPRLPPPAATDPTKEKEREELANEMYAQDHPIRAAWTETEATRNNAAECLGKLALSDPRRFFPMVEQKLTDQLAGVRAAVVSAVRFTLIDESSACDPYLTPVLRSMAQSLSDNDLEVRKYILVTLASLAHHKPAILRQIISEIQAQIYERSKIDTGLIRHVEMGPFKMKVDEGLECRKAAFDCMYSSLDACLSRLDLQALMSRLIEGMSDEIEIRALTFLMLTRLANEVPSIVVRRLDETAPAWTLILQEKAKESAVKQELDRLDASQKSALRALASLSRISSAATTPKFQQVVDQTSAEAKYKDTWKELLVAQSKTNGFRKGSNRMDLD
ncbi:uncharacterized protein L969DRAFT_76369 [Mixia osmundae IAM 14324]|uniref:TATA-binding protein interacting (TIP20) domain-containing protein n=1 Tax=Mixia osmundae (strain CBS 9802 / IAM 14324 / JCM 22182 / KY 12970) TaxID=764103 RepID=G7E0F3_MIXOS|nr:uncharacterized protein L969DRAFT_76369 [Mixia osmundae IAM 14324]KEI38321.1 hypothetical protein L969DRAFT_76369 [Mixia osmundae IAM 14324]GAA96313.1 hypothetical protein E5Q_02979 [Mixia osmundae IAM 14324]